MNRRNLFSIALMALFMLNPASITFSQSTDFITFPDEQTITLSSQAQQRLDAARAHPATVSAWLIQFHDLANVLSQEILRFSLPKIGPIVAKAVRIGQPDSSNVAWSGVLEGSQTPMFFIVVNGNVSGMIHAQQDVFRIKPLGDGEHVLIHLDQSKFVPDDPFGSDSPKKKAAPVGESQSLSSALGKSGGEKMIAAGPVIDLLVAYTQTVANNNNISSLIASCEQPVNEILINSGNSARVDVVHSVQVTYEERGITQTDINELQDNNGDDELDVVHGLRDQYGADIVVLLIAFGDHRGLAYHVPARNATEAFCVVEDGAAVSNYTFAHEIAHLVGCRHAWDPAGTYEHAHIRQQNGWKTVVASEAPSTPRIPYWSNPNKTYGGSPMGTTCCNDNARKWETRDGTVASFRSKQPPSVTISGPSALMYKESGTWTAAASGGAPPYTYAWRYRYWGTGSWSGVVDTDSQYSRLMLTQDFELKCTVTTSQGLSDEDTHYVSYEMAKRASESVVNLPEQFVLEQNYPNPFNPTTEIKYGLPEASHVTLTVFTVTGQKIRTIVDTRKRAGYHNARWDGKDAFGDEVASGLYIYRIHVIPVAGAPAFDAVRKMTMLR